MASAICSALRELVPLKAMCSSRCEMPCSVLRSERAPALTQTPSEALSRCGMSSVRTTMPLSRVVDLTLTLVLLTCGRHGLGIPCRSGAAARCNEILDLPLIVGQDRDPFGPVKEIAEPGRQSRRDPRCLCNGGRELGGMGRAKGDHGHGGPGQGQRHA